MIAAQKTANRMAKKNDSGTKSTKKSAVKKANDAVNEQNAVLNNTLQQIEKAFGQGAHHAARQRV